MGGNIKQEKRNIIEVLSTVEVLVNAIQKEIFNNTWEPGERIRETELVNMYGTSRHSIREALVALVKQEFLERRMNRGVFLRQFTKEDIEDLYFTRLILETKAVRNLARKKIVPSEIEEALKEFRKQKQSTPWSIIVENDTKFHKAIVDSLESYRTSKLFNSLLVEFKLINRKPKTFTPIESVYIKHRKLLDEIKKGNEEKAVFLISEHLKKSAQIQIKASL